MHRLNLFPVRSLRETPVRLSRPACARGFNTIFNPMMSFAERVTLPLTSASDICLRLRRQSRSFHACAVLLTGMLALVLAGCGSGGGDGGPATPTNTTPPSSDRAASNVQTIVDDERITVAWTNPDQPNIRGFNVTLFTDAAPPVFIRTILLGAPAPATDTNARSVNVTRNARVIYPITAGLTNDITYRITIAVIYADGNSVASRSVKSRPGVGAAGESFGTDLDADGVSNTEDVCPVGETNWRSNARTDNDKDGCRDSDEDDDDDNDDTNDADDAFRLDACASADADKDGMPDSLVAGCETSLTADPDDDNDRVDDADDNCPLVNNSEQTNTDAAGDGGDACDDDDDNDGTDDADDAFRLDACASADADRDGMPDSLVAGCETPLTADPDDDNDGLPDVGNATAAADNCPFVFNPAQFNNDTDEFGDACDEDDDNDGLPDVGNATAAADNCRFVFNPGQFNNDTDELGDACDDDDDNDGLPDVGNATAAADNCRFVFNPAQFNNDTDELGDACDDDDDNDGVNDLAAGGVQLDACPTGETGWISNATTDNDGDGCRDADEDLDDDNDGLPDLANATAAADNCRFVANPAQFNNDTDELGDACDDDDDNDGLPDVANATAAADNCRFVVNPAQFNNDTDEFGDACDDDDDNDGVNDLAADGTQLDNCPLIGNTDQADVNLDGEGDACEEDPADIPATMGVSNLSALPTETSLSLSWTNPSVGFIDAFEITWFPSDDSSDSGSERLDDETSEPSVNDGTIASETRTAYTISGLTTDTDYTIEVTLIADEDHPYTNRVFAVTGANADGDAYGDAEDVDDDNNGLIEIYTLDDLAWLRDDLNADGIDDKRHDNITAPGDAGCPPSGCKGYELMRSLDFMNASSYADNSANMDEWTGTGEGWTPIGSCGGASLSTCRLYSGIFNGNHHNISHLKIRHPNVEGVVYGLGLFAGLNGGTMRNLQLLDASLETSKSPSYSGLLIGRAFRSRLENVHVMRGKIKLSGSSTADGVKTNIGGLVGRVEESKLIRTSVSDTMLAFPNFGVNQMGGLVGRVIATEIVASYVADISISGIRAGGVVGGLVGTIAAGTMTSRPTLIMSSYATEIGDIVGSESAHVGGLAGRSETFIGIIASYVRGGVLSQGNVGTAGGIIARGGGAGQINASYASVGVVGSGNSAHGLSSNADTFDIEDTYWDLNTTGISANGDSRGKTAQALQSQTTFAGIYANWGNFWCDPDTGEFTTDADDSDLAIDANRAWDLGNSTQYPALTCTSGGAERQRQ